MHNQRTLREPIAFEGVGLHTGVAARAVVHPAAEGTGLVFALGGAAPFPATAEYVVDTQRATVIGNDGRTVSTVEHLLSALRGMGVDNAWIEVKGPEIPVMDGSALAFAEAIAAAGTLAQDAPRPTFAPDRATAFRDDDKTLAIIPASSWRVSFTVDYPAPIGTQFFHGEITPETYLRDIAPARTFGYLHEVEALRARGLAQGGTLENAVVYGPEGPLQPLRWPNEAVRHKVLDMIGDFALLGLYPQCEAIALKSGHKLHALAMTEMRAEARAIREHALDRR